MLNPAPASHLHQRRTQQARRLLEMDIIYWGYIGVALGIFRDNGKQNANYHIIMVIYWGYTRVDPGKVRDALRRIEQWLCKRDLHQKLPRHMVQHKLPDT